MSFGVEMKFPQHQICEIRVAISAFGLLPVYLFWTVIGVKFATRSTLFIVQLRIAFLTKKCFNDVTRSIKANDRK